MQKKQYDVSVNVNGRPVKEYVHGNHTYIESRDGTEYSIKIRNNSYSRIKAVVTVDGFSILNDDKEDFSSGYIIGGCSSITLNGYRTSDDTEAQFMFSKKGESRAQKVQGYAKNCGVIGVKIYSELVRLVQYGASIQYGANIRGSLTDDSMSFDSRCAPSSFTSSCVGSELRSCIATSSCATPSFDMGSSMGEDVHSPVKHVEFEEGSCVETFEIFYASHKSLEQVGIDFRPIKQVHVPQAFNGYCKRPR